MRLDKIYTRTGDGGQTSLVTGERVAKQHMRIEAAGTIDELNCVLGLVRTAAPDAQQSEVRKESADALRQIQNDLFDLGAVLACSPARAGQVLAPFPEGKAALLEARIDRYQERLEGLSSFVLPGGTMLNAYAHLARAVCRRAERVLWRLHETEPVPASMLTYVNRLSDYLFVYSRWVMRLEGKEEFLWEKGRAGPPDPPH